jgi:hypothetical protein
MRAFILATLAAVALTVGVSSTVSAAEGNWNRGGTILAAPSRVAHREDFNRRDRDRDPHVRHFRGPERFHRR